MADTSGIIKSLQKDIDRLKQDMDAMQIQIDFANQRNYMYQKMLSHYILTAYYDREQSDLNILDALKNASDIMINRDMQPLMDSDGTFKKYLHCLTDASIRDFPYRSNSLHFDMAMIFGLKDIYENARLILSAKEHHRPVIFFEGGSLLSVLPPSQNNYPEKYRWFHSMVMDQRSMYFDANHVSDLEIMLNSPMELRENQIHRAKMLMDKIVSNKISKYNHQPICQIEYDKTKERILIVDQMWGDASISYGLATDDVFHKMLEDAVRDNPQAEILIKTHPEANHTRKRKHFDFEHDAFIQQHGVQKIDYDLNPYSLLETVDKVYVCTSQLGLEALMAGKEVHVYGMPFYAGWGATVDELHLDRRTRKRTVEEIVYIFYVMYMKCVSYKTDQLCTPEQAISELICLREEFFHDARRTIDD